MNTLYYGDSLKILRDFLSEPGAVATGFRVRDGEKNPVITIPGSDKTDNVLFRGRIGRQGRIADHGVRRHMALEPRRRASLQRTDKRTRSGRPHDRILSSVHRQQPDDGLSRHDGRPPERASPCPKADRLALSPLRPDRFALFKALLRGPEKWFILTLDIGLLSE